MGVISIKNNVNHFTAASSRKSCFDEEISSKYKKEGCECPVSETF